MLNAPAESGISSQPGARTAVGWAGLTLGRWLDDLLPTLLVLAGLALFLSLSSAFGTGAVPATDRTVYWFSLLAAGRLAAFLVDTLVRTRLRSWPVWASAGLYLAIATPAVTLAVSLVTAVWFQVPLGWDHYAALLGPVLVITAAAAGLQALVHRLPYRSFGPSSGRNAWRRRGRSPGQSRIPGGGRHRRSRPTATAAEGSVVSLASRLPPLLRDADILAVSAEDHYLRIRTSAGDSLVHMRFMDALGELDGIEGSQTHRSHWVARAAVASVERRRGHTGFRLTGGVRIPVSRTYLRALREEGWMDLP